jgi:tetratricopeptide (TPR) repeat protein
MTKSFSQKRALYLISASLVIATIVAYEPVRKNGFVDLDDGAYITKNPNVNEGITLQSVVWAFTKFHSGNWHPLTWLSHTLDCEIYGLNPLGHHTTSVIIHIANSLLLFWVLRKMTASTPDNGIQGQASSPQAGTIWPSAFVAGVFALHPVHVESVAWAAERKDVLSGLFWMLTMLAYARYVERPNIKRYALVLLAFLMGLMSKPMVITLPFVLLLLDWWPLERIEGRWTRDEGRTFQKVSIRRLIKEKIPLFALSAVSSVITIIAQHSGGAVVTLESMPVSYRIANTFVSYIRYIGKTLWPNRLAVLYPQHFGDIPEAIVVTCVLLFVLLTILGIHIGRHRRYIATGWLWYIGTLVPVIGLVQVGSQAIADRYMYIPMVGLLIIIAWAVKDVIADNRRRQKAAAALAVTVLLISVILTRMQVRHWQNNLSLFGHTVNVTEANPFAETSYGHALYIAGHIDEGLSHMQKAVRINPNFSAGRDTLGIVLMEQGKINEAVACFNEVIRRDKSWKEGYINLGAALSRQGKYDEAIKYINKALELDPKYANARSKKGTVLMMAGRLKEAVADLNEGLQTSTDAMEVYVNLAIAYGRLGDNELSLRNRSKAMGLKSDNPETLNNLAWLLATGEDISVADAKKAVELAQGACELTGYKKPGFLDTLAAAYAAAGRFEEAAKTAEQAVDTAKAGGQEDLIGEVQKRMELYKTGQRYEQK